MSKPELMIQPRLVSCGLRWGKAPAGYTVVSAQGLRNPPSNLWQRAGTDPTVRAYVMEDPKARALVMRVLEYLESGRRVAVQCWGGKHRSVAIVETVRELLPGVTYLHRDITRQETRRLPLVDGEGRQWSRRRG